MISLDFVIEALYFIFWLNIQAPLIHCVSEGFHLFK